MQIRSNSSNAINKSDDILQAELNTGNLQKYQNHNSAQRVHQKNRKDETGSLPRPTSMLNSVKLAISEKKSSFVNGSQRPNMQGIHMLPSTNKVYRNTKRIDFNRRMQMMDRPIVIINFEGIIGHFHKEKIWSEKNFKLITRGHASNGLRMFWNYFQVVVYVRKNLKKNTVKVKDWMKSKGILVDAIYTSKEVNDSVEEDYAQIYNDFNIVNSKQIAKSIIVINSVDIDIPNIEGSQLEKMIFDKTQGYIVSGLPYTINWNSMLEEKENKSFLPKSKPKSIMDMPLSIMFPNVLSENGEDLSMISIFKVVISIAFLSLKDYSENFKHSDLKSLKESDVKLQRQFLGLDLSNVWQRSNSCDALLRKAKWDEEDSTTILSDSETKKVSALNFKNSDSANNSFEMNQTAKMVYSDDETSGPESWSSAQTMGNDRISNFDHKSAKGAPISTGSVKQKVFQQKTLNETSLSKVNWLIGFEEASNKKLFDWLWICTKKVNELVKKRTREALLRQKLKNERDQSIARMICDEDTTEEEYNKNKSVQITAMVSTIFKEAYVPGNPIQSMMARNIRHFETIRKQTLAPIIEQKDKSQWEIIPTEVGKESPKLVQDSKSQASLFLAQASRYKHINNHILAFGFTANTKQLFSRVEKDKEEMVSEEDFDLLKWFFGRNLIN